MMKCSVLVFALLIVFSSSSFGKEKCKKHGKIPLYLGPGTDMGPQCCKNLKHKTQKAYFDDKCANLAVYGYTGICLACGDGKCDKKYESRCNCPQDCK